MREKSYFMGESEQVWITDLCLNINFYEDTKVLLKHIKQQFFTPFYGVQWRVEINLGVTNF